MTVFPELKEASTVWLLGLLSAEKPVYVCSHGLIGGGGVIALYFQLRR